MNGRGNGFTVNEIMRYRSTSYQVDSENHIAMLLTAITRSGHKLTHGAYSLRKHFALYADVWLCASFERQMNYVNLFQIIP